jgi:hypothetical protein
MNDGSSLVMKPSAGMRGFAWALAAFGAIFGLSGTAATVHSLVLAIWMGLFGLLMMLLAINGAVAKLTCDPAGLCWRTLRTVRVPASEITTVGVQTVPGFGYRRVRIDVHRQSGRRVKLTQLQRPNTPANLAKSEADAEAMRRVLGASIPAASA